jgi:hypothetical protein
MHSTLEITERPMAGSQVAVLPVAGFLQLLVAQAAAGASPVLVDELDQIAQCRAEIKLGSLSNRALLINNLFDVALFCNSCVAVVYFSPRRFGLAVRAISIRRRIASGRPGLSS